MSNMETKMPAEELLDKIERINTCDSDQRRSIKEAINTYTSSLTAEVEKAYREGFQDGREWAMDDSEVGEDAYWEKSQAKAAIEGKGGDSTKCQSRQGRRFVDDPISGQDATTEVAN